MDAKHLNNYENSVKSNNIFTSKLNVFETH